MNKQIEEMAHDMCEYFYEGTCYQDKKAGDCKCDIFTDAEYLYGKGYRKASDVKSAICAAIQKDFSLAIKRLEKAKLNLIGDMRIYADGKLSAYKSILSDLPRIIGLYKESEGTE